MADHLSVARVVLDVRLPQLDRLFDYAIPDGWTVRPGVRVRVPLGKKGRVVSGFVVEVLSDTDFTGTLAPLDALVSDVVVLRPEMWDLAREVADRQAGSAADILRLAIPPRAARYEKAWEQRVRAENPSPVIEPPEPPESVSREGWAQMVAPGERIALTLPSGVVTSATPGRSVPRGYALLAHYAASLLAQGESVLCAVPDWRDVELLHRAVTGVCPEESVVLWRGEGTPTERYTAFLRTLEDRPTVVLGSRHAVWAPLSNLGAIIVVGESDASHREPLAPYPHTRDVALVRHTHSSARLVFADWVPSADTMRLMDMGYLRPVVADGSRRPRVIPTALVAQGDQPVPGRLPSVAHRGVSEALREGPVLVQVFRAGFAPGLSCAGCSAKVRCGHCGGPLRAGDRHQVPQCGWCGIPEGAFRCADCGSTTLRPRGQAVGRTLAELGRAFPGVPVVRADGDHRVLDVSSAPSLVVATRGAEPIADGGYRAVLLLDGEAMLQREALDAEVETLRGWEWALSLAAADAKVFLTDVSGDVVTHFAAGASAERVRRDWLLRKDLSMPPAVRVVSLSGGAAAIPSFVEAACAVDGSVDALGPVVLPDGRQQVLVRTPYAHAPRVAATLRAEVIAQAVSRRPPSERVRVVVDDRDALDDVARSAG